MSIEVSEASVPMINDELIQFIDNNFRLHNKDYITRAIRMMDKFGYNGYSLDLYNFVNISEINFDPDEAKLLFINLVVTHVIKLIESIGLVISDDLVNEDYSEYMYFFVELLETLWMIKNMTNIDAIYFVDFINNENYTDMEIIYLIVSYYNNDLKEDLYYKLVDDFKATFLDIIKTKINDYVIEDIDDSEIEIDIKDIVLLKSLSDVIFEKSKKSLFASMLISIGDDLKYLFKNIDFVKLNVETNSNKLIKIFSTNSADNYYAFLPDDEDLYTLLLDIMMFAIVYDINFIKSDNPIESAYEQIKNFIHEKNVKGLSGIMKSLDKVKTDVNNIFGVEEFKTNFINFIKGEDDEQ